MKALKSKGNARSSSLFKSRDLLSWDEAAAYLGPSFTPRWVKRQVYEYGTIKAIRLNGRCVIPRSELDRLVDTQLAEAGAA